MKSRYQKLLELLKKAIRCKPESPARWWAVMPSTPMPPSPPETVLNHPPIAAVVADVLDHYQAAELMVIGYDSLFENVRVSRVFEWACPFDFARYSRTQRPALPVKSEHRISGVYYDVYRVMGSQIIDHIGTAYSDDEMSQWILPGGGAYVHTVALTETITC